MPQTGRGAEAALCVGPDADRCLQLLAGCQLPGDRVVAEASRQCDPFSGQSLRGQPPTAAAGERARPNGAVLLVGAAIVDHGPGVGLMTCRAAT